MPNRSVNGDLGEAEHFLLVVGSPDDDVAQRFIYEIAIEDDLFAGTHWSVVVAAERERVPVDTVAPGWRNV